jgi:hypothetical protein
LPKLIRSYYLRFSLRNGISSSVGLQASSPGSCCALK